MFIALKAEITPHIDDYAQVKLCIRPLTRNIFIFMPITPPFEFLHITIKIFPYYSESLLIIMSSIFFYYQFECSPYLRLIFFSDFFQHLSSSFAALFIGDFSIFCFHLLTLKIIP
jgi:hypothetical protein